MKSILSVLFFLSSNLALASTAGEVKILYPCEALNSIPHEKETRGTVTFLDTKEFTLYKSGLILRKRTEGEEKDITLKMRWKTTPVVDEKIKAQLSASPNGELKCEADVTAFSSVESCSFKADGHTLLREHVDFLSMVKSPVTEIPSNLKEISLESISWKIPLSGLKKKPNLEMWKKNGECLLEASAKFDNGSADSVLKALKNAIKAGPSEVQISKTAWALGIK